MSSDDEAIPEGFLPEEIVNLPDAPPVNGVEAKLLKKLGIINHKYEETEEWQAIKSLGSREETIAYMLAFGSSPDDIAAEINLDPSYIKTLSQRDSIKRRSSELRDKYLGADIQKRFQNIVSRAVDVAEKILMNEDNNPGLRSDVAFKFMDRALGKPKQSVEVQGNTVAELIHYLDNNNIKTVEQVDDSVDDFVRNKLPGGSIIGERKKEDSKE